MSVQLFNLQNFRQHFIKPSLILKQNKRDSFTAQLSGNPLVQVIQKEPTHCLEDLYLCATSLLNLYVPILHFTTSNF